MPARRSHAEPWYTDAIIYGVDVAKFADGNGDGIGDFVGLKSRLPYLVDLGITCLWILPFYRTPNRDNGYDVSDYLSVNPEMGTFEEFLDFLHAAGERGIRVLCDLVVNHTSDQHPWFIAARHDEKSRYRNYYIWSPEPPPMQPGEVSIFPGEVDTVWTYDPVARAYYFHKFYPFQPELNFANSEVLDEACRIIDFWLALGVSGFRLDAAPLIVSKNGLARDNPKDPSGVFETLNDAVERRRDDAVLLGEVNMPIEEVAGYFGKGQQLRLLLNFQGAAYLFAALADEDAEIVRSVIRLVPKAPVRCAWANFLRNVDELDFSRVPAEIKEKAFAAFAPDPAMRAFGRGIRRRVAPMLGGDTRRIALAFSLMFSLPGTPLLVYGDEIGMGEDLSRPGRNAVRAPMQWDASASAGFSEAPVRRLVQKLVSDPAFAPRRVNVADQQQDPESLLNRVKRLTAVRRRHPIRAQGYALPETGHPAVLAQLVTGGNEVLVLVHNLSGRKVEARVDLGEIAATAFTDLISDEHHAAKAHRLRLSLPPYGYLWLRAEKE